MPNTVEHILRLAWVGIADRSTRLQVDVPCYPEIHWFSECPEDLSNCNIILGIMLFFLVPSGRNPDFGFNSVQRDELDFHFQPLHRSLEALAGAYFRTTRVERHWKKGVQCNQQGKELLKIVFPLHSSHLHIQ